MESTVKVKIFNKDLFGQQDGSLFVFSTLLSFMRLPMPAGIAYKMAKNMKALRPLHEAYEETRLKIMEEAALKDEAGKPIIENGRFKFETPQIEQEAINKVNELNKADNEIEFQVVKKADLEKVNGMTGNMMLAFLDFVDPE